MVEAVRARGNMVGYMVIKSNGGLTDRGERACQLIRDLRYDVFRLMGWFGWSSQDMPLECGPIQGAGLEEDMKVDYR
jgi:hypothetical protein